MIRKLHAPAIVDPRTEALELRCEYELHGKELYSVNWYRNYKMIYRYLPSIEPKGTVYHEDSDSDVQVNLGLSDAMRLMLQGNQDVRKSE